MTDLESIVFKKRLGTLSGSDLVSWAVAALSAGLDSPGLCRLAGLDLDGDARLFDAEQLFKAAVRELRIDLPDEGAATWACVRDLAQEIVDGKAPPQAQAARIHSEILSPLNHPRNLMPWCYVMDGLRPWHSEGWSLDPDAMVHFETIPEHSLDDAIRELAAWYLAQTSRL